MHNRNALDKQVKAWAFYGIPYTHGSSSSLTKVKACEPVGEVRYIVGWAADQMSRMEWKVLINGEDEWTLTLPGGETVRATAATDEDDDDDTLAEASAKVLDLINWTPSTVRQITTNLFVAGELDFYAVSAAEAKKRGIQRNGSEGAGETWLVGSVINPDRDKIKKTAVHIFTGLWPHPADPTQPDAPLFGVLPILAELDWLSKVSRAQSANRVGMRGIVGAADGMAGPEGKDFWTTFEEGLQARIEDPTNMAPDLIRGPAELVEPVASGKGMKGLSWVIPDFPYDDKLADKVSGLIRRLAYGLPIPPEILLGLQAQSRATAFQVEGNAYVAHIEPQANLVAAIGTEALQLLLEGVTVEIVPDPQRLLARRATIADAFEAWDRGLVTASYVLDVLGIPVGMRATEDDLRLLERIRARTQSRQDPGTEAAAEGATTAVTASVGAPSSDPLNDEELSELAQQLAAVDHALMMELAGATEQAVDRARERVGARARTFQGLRSAVPGDVRNDQVAAELGSQLLTDTGVPVAELVTAALEPLGRWWESRAAKAQATVQALLGPDAPASLTDHDVSVSADLLIDLTASHVLATLDSDESSALHSDDRARVLDVLGGQ